MSIVTHERPGVYSSYTVSSVVSGSTGGKAVGLAALCQTGTAGVPVQVTRYEDAASAFGSESGLTELTRLLLENGASAVWAVPVASESGYAAAFTALEAVESIAVTVCDSSSLTVQQALRDSVCAASQARRERIGVVCGASGESVSALVNRAAELNSERMVLTAPGGTELAAAVAGAIAGESDPAVPLGGAELTGTDPVSVTYNDNEIDLLVRGGVTPLETVAGVTSVVRAVTTRTKTGESADNTWRELSTILIVDDVIPGVRSSLRSKFRRAKNTEQSRGAIRTQVVVELENRISREIITSYGNVAAEALESDPTICLVTFSFTLAHGLNQIWLTAHITV